MDLSIERFLGGELKNRPICMGPQLQQGRIREYLSEGP